MKLALCILFVAAASAQNPTVNKYMRPAAIQRFYSLIKADGQDRIVGGIDSPPHSRPYQLGIFLTVPGGTAFCGGSLISRDYVLTAAHCVNDGNTVVSMFEVVLGAHSLNDDHHSVRYQTTNAKTHPDWNPSTLQNDIALLKLPVSVELDNYIKIVELPPRSEANNEFVDKPATITGWGLTSDSDTQLVDILKEVTVNVITNTVCNSRYNNIQPTMVCTNGSGGKGACNGDSGGPLVTDLNGSVVQIGIVSFGNRQSCEAGWPSVFTRITKYLSWIADNSNAVIKP